VDFEIVSPASPQEPGMERAPRPGSLPATATADAVAAIYQDHLGMVWGILGRARVLQPELREDLAHDVFVLVHQLYPARNERVPVHAWVAAITWNVIRNHRARERVKREVPMAIPDMHEPAARGASPEEAAEIASCSSRSWRAWTTISSRSSTCTPRSTSRCPTSRGRSASPRAPRARASAWRAPT
jgi:hypothetical protein